jgi:SAM-dependent methyltransferase
MISACRVCDSNELELAIDLGQQPWCNHFLKESELGREPFYPLRVVYCHACSTAQLDYTVPKEVMFGDHTYLSGVTRSLSAHFRGVAETTLADHFAGRDAASISVLDIGSNDGTQLKHFQALGCRVLGVEPSKATAALANAAGVPTLQRYFNAELARELDQRFQIVNAAGVFFHLEELHSAADGIGLVLAEDGVFVVQFLYMKSIADNLAFDQIYHEHLLYYNLRTIEVLLNRHGMALFDAYLSPIHGGSMIASVAHAGRRPPSARLEQLRRAEDDSGANALATYRELARRMALMKEANLAYLRRCKDEGKVVFGMGAPVKGNTMLNYFGVGTQYIDVLVEKNPLRDGLYSPGMHIPVVMEDALAAPPDVYYVLAWNFKREILANNQHLLERGVEFYFPVNPKEA